MGKKRVLITGSKGQLGSALSQTAPKDLEVSAHDIDDLDITDLRALASFVENHRPDIIINAAGYTDVESAETDIQCAHMVNTQGSANLATISAQNGIRLLHVSTDYVFDGLKRTPYMPDDCPRPVNSYGKTKYEGEKLVKEILPNNFLIVRTSGLYSDSENNFLTKILKLLNQRDVVGVVNDQISSPTQTKGFAKALWEFARRDDLTGTFHWADSGSISWYDFAFAICKEAKEMKLLRSETARVEPITSAEYPSRAKRPAYSVLDGKSSRNALGLAGRCWSDALEETIKAMAGKLE